MTELEKAILNELRRLPARYVAHKFNITQQAVRDLKKKYGHLYEEWKKPTVDWTQSVKDKYNREMTRLMKQINKVNKTKYKPILRD